MISFSIWEKYIFFCIFLFGICWCIEMSKKCTNVSILKFPKIFSYNLTILEWESTTFRSSKHSLENLMYGHLAYFRPSAVHTIRKLIFLRHFCGNQEPICQLSWRLDFKWLRLARANKQTNKLTNTQTDNALYIYR